MPMNNNYDPEHNAIQPPRSAAVIAGGMRVKKPYHSKRSNSLGLSGTATAILGAQGASMGSPIIDPEIITPEIQDYEPKVEPQFPPQKNENYIFKNSSKSQKFHDPKSSRTIQQPRR